MIKKNINDFYDPFYERPSTDPDDIWETPFDEMLFVDYIYKNQRSGLGWRYYA